MLLLPRYWVELGDQQVKAPENLEGTHVYIDLDRVTNFEAF